LMANAHVAPTHCGSLGSPLNYPLINRSLSVIRTAQSDNFFN
jgi:hypothetical protein